MKAIILARVSTEEQKEAGNSLPAQIERLNSYCRRKGFTAAKVFSLDESAYKTKRDDFDRALDYLKSTKEKIVVCFDKVDRFSRNVFDKRVAYVEDRGHRRAVASLGDSRFIIAYSIPWQGGKVMMGEYTGE